MKKLLRYLITTAVGLAIVLIIILTKDIFGQSSTKQVMRILCDAFFVSGGCLACFGLIVFASDSGAFDMLAYAVQIFFFTIRDACTKGKAKRKYKDFYEYSKSKEGRKHSISYILIVGLVLIAISFLFLALYNHTV